MIVPSLNYHPSDSDVNTSVIHISDGMGVIMEDIPARLKRLRLEKKMTQTALASAAGVTQGTIGNVESGLRGYGESLVNIARALAVSPQYLRCEPGTPRKPAAEVSQTNSDAKTVRRVDVTGNAPGAASDTALQHTEEEPPPLTIPTAMPYEPRHLKSAVLLMGNLLGALDKRTRKVIGVLLKDLTKDPDGAEEIAIKISGYAALQKPVTKDPELDKAIQGRKDRDPVETGPALLEHLR